MLFSCEKDASRRLLYHPFGFLTVSFYNTIRYASVVFNRMKPYIRWGINGMGDIAITDVRIFQGKTGLIKGSLYVSGDRIRAVVSETEENRVHCTHSIRLPGRYVFPGLIDIHTHGNSGFDFSDGSREGLRQIGRYLANHGITSFLPTSMTLPYEKLETAFHAAEEYMSGRPSDGARVIGIHMEGPFFSEKKNGAQNKEFLKQPDAEEFFRLQDSCGHAVRIVDVAPELEGAEDFIRRASADCRVSVGHSDASYEETMRAFEAGASHLTHLFNAMPPFQHREPGVIGAACDKENVIAELICDGLHVHPGAVRMAFRMFPGRICLISDALPCCGMPDGDYELGGQRITLKKREVRLPDGKLAGAVSDLYEDMINAIHFGIPTEDAVLAATMIPAEAAGMETDIGSLEPGKKADFIICDENWHLEQVYIDGIRIR